MTRGLSGYSNLLASINVLFSLSGNNDIAKFLCLTNYKTTEDRWRNQGENMYDALKEIVENIRRQIRWVNF